MPRVRVELRAGRPAAARRPGGPPDDTAFSELVDLDGNLCYAIAYRILRDPERAQDAVQQAFLLAWRELPQLRDAERFGPWLHKLLVNACYDELRRHRRWSTRIRALPMDGPGGPDPMLTVEDRDTLDRAFARLVDSGSSLGPSSSQAATTALRSRGGFMRVVPPPCRPGYRQRSPRAGPWWRDAVGI